MDAGVLEDILWHIHNWFERDSLKVTGCEIADGSLPASVTSQILVRQWYRIEGSMLNDGLHQHPATDLEDETFDGTVTLLAIPKPLIRVAEQIEEYRTDTEESDKEARTAKFKSESFDGYSYTHKDDSRSGSGSGGLSGWQAAFASDLNPWRKMY